MDISISSVGDKSSVSGRPFSPGQRVWSLLCRTEEGYLERVDLLPGELQEYQAEGSVICRWSQVVREPEATDAQAKRAALQSAEDVFLSLFDEPEAESGEPLPVDEARDRLKFFLALQLERKRILKPLGGRRFRHMPSKREFTVPDFEVTPEVIALFQNEISHMGRVT